MRDIEDEIYFTSSDDDDDKDGNLPPPPKRFHVNVKNLAKDTVRVAHHSNFMIC